MSAWLPDLLRTELHLIGLLGQVEEHADYIVARTPLNPGFYHGNFLLLPGPPEDLDLWLQRFEAAFGSDVKHRCFSWIGAPLSEPLVARAAELGLLADSGVALALDAPPETPPAPELDWSVRPLDPVRDWSAIEALNKRCDPAEADSPASYRAFKARLRDAIQEWTKRGAVTWWGGFDGERLVGQCGMAVVGDLGRFQAVETHPRWRGRGVCSALVAAVAQDAFTRHGCRRVLLQADHTGPAVNLYRRLGFREETPFHSLVRPSETLHVRVEGEGDHAAVRSLNRAAFEGAGEADLVDRLREVPGVISLVASQSGAVVGHAFFTPVRVEGEGDAEHWSAMALGPMAVRPDRQRGGVGTTLMKAGLEACRDAGEGVCFVLGHPAYYPRAGFRSAPPLGLTCQWPVPDDVFMVAEVEAGALKGRTGRVHYDPVFDEV